MYNLERALGEVSGMRTSRCSRAPAAWRAGGRAPDARLPRGSRADAHQGPDARHRARDQPGNGDDGGYDGRQGRHDPDGGVDLDDLRDKADDRSPPDAHQPQHAGLFDPNITEIAKIVHDVGATLYYDGANLNAIMGKARPGDMGFDIVHFNLHKSFTQPHGGGGPGSGPIAVSERMKPYLMIPRIVRAGEARSTSTTTATRSRSAACAGSRATTGASCAPTPTSARSAPRG